MEFTFLSLSEVLEIHLDQIHRYGGLPGIRDMELLKSALGMPAATYNSSFLHTDVYEMASAYLFHIVINHPFIDGNKRTGTVAALIFLMLNGYEFHAPREKLTETVLKVADGSLSKTELSLFFKKWTKK
jgi:death-on-curing protein